MREVCDCEEIDCWIAKADFIKNKCGFCLKPLVDKSKFVNGEVGVIKGFSFRFVDKEQIDE